MKKRIYHGETTSKINELKKSAERVLEETGQACYLMREVFHLNGVTLSFHYYFNPNSGNEEHMTELTVFGSEEKISKIEKELNQIPLPEEDHGPFGKNPYKKDDGWTHPYKKH